MKKDQPNQKYIMKQIPYSGRKPNERSIQHYANDMDQKGYRLTNRTEKPPSGCSTILFGGGTTSLTFERIEDEKAGA